jgi:spore germination protein KB
MVTTVFPTAILFLPSIAAVAQQDAWIAPLIATGSGLYLSLLIYGFGKRFPQRGLLGNAETFLGPYIGKAIGAGYVVFFFITASVVLREVGEFMTSVFMRETPLIVFLGVMGLAVSYMVRQGIEVIARVNWFIPLFIIVILVTLLFTLPLMDLERLRPLGEAGPWGLARASLSASAFRGEMIILTLMIPNLHRPQEAGKAALWANLILGGILIINGIAVVATFGPMLPDHLVFPTFSLFRVVTIGGFLNRLDIFLMTFWLAAVFVKFGIFQYACCLSIAQVFGLKDYRRLALVVGLLLIGVAHRLATSIVGVVGFLEVFFGPFALPFEYLVPSVILLAGVIRSLIANPEGVRKG